MKKEKHYSIAIRKRQNSDDRFFLDYNYKFKELNIPSMGRYWFADPFVFEKNRNTYVFFEAFDLIRRVGCIGVSKIDSAGNASKPHIIIRGSHFSFPCIFEYNDDIYIVPESCQTNTVDIYKAIDFPNYWEKAGNLINDVFVVDSICFKIDTHKYLICSEQFRFPEENKVVSCWVRNKVFELEGSSKTEYSFHYKGVVAEGDFGIRNAGNIFKYQSVLVRPGQNCQDGTYGKGLVFYEMNGSSLKDTKCIYSVDYDEMQHHIDFSNRNKVLVGTHTYNSSDNYEVIDFSYYNNISLMVMINRKLVQYIRTIRRIPFKMFATIRRITNKVSKKIYYNEEIYKSVIDKNAPWVFVSYIAHPFYHRNDYNVLDRHQNNREAIVMEKVFNNLGYNVFFMLHSSKKDLPDIDCHLVFGHEPNFIRACKKYDKAKHVYYGVSTYYEYRNNKIKEMTDHFNDVYNLNMPYKRLVNPHNAIDLADNILLIGSKTTISTFPDYCQNKITLIKQSTQNNRTIKYLEVNNNKNFLFVAGDGNALKGVCLLLEFFTNNPEYILHWLGPIDLELSSRINDIITPNIHIYGFQNMNSDLVLGLMERCDFILYPSGVEGVPGSVLNAMKNGLIPLVTPWASFDEIDNLGYVMKNTDVKSIQDAVEWATSLDKDSILKKKIECQNYVIEHFNLDEYEKQFSCYFSKLLGK